MAALAARGGAEAHQQQPGDDCQKQAVDGEAPGWPKGSQEQPADARPDDPRTVEHHPVERDGVGHVFFSDHLDHKGLAGGGIKGIDHPDQDGQNKMCHSRTTLVKASTASAKAGAFGGGLGDFAAAMTALSVIRMP